MGKRVLLIGGNYSPELTGIGKYNGEMINYIAAQGYDCTVVTTFPYYPHWQVQEPFTKSSWFYKTQVVIPPTSTGHPIEVHRCPHYIPKNPSGLKRVISDFSFFFSALVKIIGFLFKKKFDVIMVVAPPFQLGLLGLFYRAIKGGRLIYHIQDLQIDAARDFNLIKSAFIINLLLKVEKYILMKADVVSSISAGMIKKIVAKYPREVVFFPNWVDTSQFYPLLEKRNLKKEFNFEETDKIVLYSGAIGEKQGLETILESAEELKDQPGVKFVICGSGPYKEKLRAIKEARNLHNVFFLPLQSYEKLNSFLNMADIHLVIQKANATDLVMPSKLTAILSVGGVALITANEGSSLYDVVNEHGMGVLVQPENSKAFVEALGRTLEGNQQIINQNARLYAERYLSIDEIFRSFKVHM
ncbi:MAG: WcaI family glycosyltransferase [Ferruginibacter sp.]|nr:WcaI family glycosyltransferase [Ferruginibacter sp.]